MAVSEHVRRQEQERESKRVRVREKEMHREIGIYSHRETETKRHIHRETLTEKETERNTHREKHTHWCVRTYTHRETHRDKDIQTETQIETERQRQRYRNREGEGEGEGGRDRGRDRQTDMTSFTFILSPQMVFLGVRASVCTFGLERDSLCSGSSVLLSNIKAAESRLCCKLWCFISPRAHPSIGLGRDLGDVKRPRAPQ